MIRHEFKVGERLIECSAERKGEIVQVEVDGRIFQVRSLGDNQYAVTTGDATLKAAAVTVDGKTYVEINSVLIELTEPGEDVATSVGGDHDTEPDKVYAPMPGKVVKLLVVVGDVVEPNQPAVIVEAMKMENPVMVRAKGVVRSVNFAVGDQVDTDSPIIELDLDKE